MPKVSSRKRKCSSTSDIVVELVDCTTHVQPKSRKKKAKKPKVDGAEDLTKEGGFGGSGLTLKRYEETKSLKQLWLTLKH